jgi:hypothetical protein
MPTVIEEKKQSAIFEIFRAGIHALGLAGKESIGAAKGDIKLTAAGPMIGEIAARLSGGYMSGWTYPYSSGALPIKAAVLAAMGRKPERLTPIKKQTCAERAFISIPGTVKQIEGVEKAKTVNCVNDFFLRVTEGSNVAFPENNVTKCGNIIASAEDRESAINAAETAARSIFIRLDPSDPQTAQFLSQDTQFPPSAFQLTNELKTALAHIPSDIDLPHRTSPIFLSKKSSLQLIPFPEFTSSGLKDFMGRTVEEVLDAVRLLTGFPIPVTSENAENIIRLGKTFWAALIRGSYQGAVYYIDKLGVKIES